MKNTLALWAIAITALGVILFGAGCSKDNPVVDDPVVIVPDFWERTMGPGGGIVLALTGNAKGYLFAGTAPEGEIFRSKDDGDTWEPVYDTDEAYITCFAVDTAGRLLAGTSHIGILRSPDDGKSWSPINNGLPETITGYKRVSSLAVNSGGVLLAATNDGVYRSLDNGATWHAASAGIGCSGIGCLAIDSAGTIFAGTVENNDDPLHPQAPCGVYRSGNNGDTWESINNGLPAASHIFDIIAYSGDHLLVSTDDGAN